MSTETPSLATLKSHSIPAVLKLLDRHCEATTNARSHADSVNRRVISIIASHATSDPTQKFLRPLWSRLLSGGCRPPCPTKNIPSESFTSSSFLFRLAFSWSSFLSS
ncbi:hypothetical protein M5K25_016638 [Dendrobium thyrsiflorum]|uniref:Uncharacterized protein n=1 Tax=Dendrobium thyrsiflorum TaxID=117978 RepID=A0ABD0UKQ0_DENTH